ncbi:hypothetical protein [Streptomyces sp. ISL-11]|uniref:hypothetical protein n=1 Tax=Streptomyces sp. ISL-11 TaxID=2819174 RepID=UPI001BEB1E78|nr:hypothetical protein [Streptomyces sp. ISL-11]MBT2382424.1 hypothetical protein [Streptomyces sp. ISL-11]
MTNQPHNAYEPREPYDPYRPQETYGQQPHEGYGQQQEGYAPYDHGSQGAPGAQPPAQNPGAYDTHNPYDGGAYDPYTAQGHAQGHAQQPQSPAAWPTTQGGQQGYAQSEPPTQTWQTPTWDTQTWQRPAAPAPAADDAYGAPRPGGPLPEAVPGYGQGPSGFGEGASGPYPRHGGHHRADDGATGGEWPGVTESRAPGRHAQPGPPGPVPGAQEPEEPDAAAPDASGRPMTAAEKARAEGRPQILSPGLKPAVLTSVLAALLALAAPVGQLALVVPVVLLQAVTAAGWFRLNGMWPARQGIALAFMGGVAADIGLLATDTGQAPTVLIGTMGVWLLLTLVLQLRSHASPDERLYGLMVAGASAALTVVAAGHLAAAAHSDAVVVGAAGVAVAALARALPLPSFAAPVVALVAAAGSGVATGGLTGMGNSGALLALAAGACALIGLRVASYDYPSRFVHMTAGVALPLAAAAPAVYLIGRALA